MSELDLEAIRARVRNLEKVRAAGDNGSFAGMLPAQLWQVAQGYAADVPALLDHIAELERENADLYGKIAVIGQAMETAYTVYKQECEKNAAAMAIVDALANEARYQSETGEGSTAYLARLITKAQAFMAGETPPTD